MAQSQLSLNLDIKHDASLSDFSGPGWMSIIDAVRQLHVGLIGQLYLFGSPATGKSHLLSAICESFIDMDKSAICLSLNELIHTDVNVLSSLENFDVIAIDDLEVLEQSRQWQEALFHLINRSREGQRQLLFAANKPASELPFELRDLLTRLAQAPTFKVPDGQNIADRQALLQSILRRRGWQFDERILHHLLSEGPHRIGALIEVLVYIQPMFSNLGRSNISKAVISDALRTIDEQTLAAELADITQETQTDNQIANQDQHTMPLDF
ncbi:DnaA regulatory inactivator Hda [Psychrobacter sp. T6-1]|uniref:DnaA regulatory inactivator Hda n=1 Tax=Psychrobacter sp. T6-1 TaxID=3457447 RepID=UPI00293D8EC4|nr:DnaA regulatory inactivator Hda [uncultured Psychrobacter sp.]